MAKKKKQKIIEIIIYRFRTRFFSWTFLGTLILLFIFQISIYTHWIVGIILMCAGWLLWGYLLEKEINNWIKDKMRVKLIYG